MTFREVAALVPRLQGASIMLEPIARDARIDFAGTWHNQHGSTMDLEVGARGEVTGRFRTAVGLAEPGEEFAVTGFVQGDMVAFTVDFGARRSLTAWVGHGCVEGGVARLETLWQMVVAGPSSGARPPWRGTWAGADTFARARSETPPAAGRRPSHPIDDPYLGTP